MSRPAVTAALDALFQPFARSDAPGLVVGIAHRGQLLYRRAFGLASVEHGVANSVHTRMRIGSVSKHFTALAVLLLAEEGRLDLEGGISRWLPELRAPGPEPTLRQLLTHTGGLRDSLDLSLIASGLVLRPAGDALAAMVRQREANFPPGQRMVYSNGGYHLLSLALERAEGRPFEAVMRERVFEPLGLHDTRCVPSDFELVPGLATLHLPAAAGGWRRGMFPSDEVKGEGGMVSTVDDMLRWLAHLREPHLLGRPASWALMMQPTTLANGRSVPYGFGLQLEPLRGLPAWQHGGTVIGGSCHLLTLPSQALDLIVMANGAPGSLAELSARAAEAVLGEQAFPEPPERRPRTADQAGLVGTRYASRDGGMVLAFADADGSLAVRLHQSPPLPLAEDAGAWVLPFSRSVTGPYHLAPPAGVPEAIELDDAGAVLQLQRLPAEAPPLAQAGAALCGRYRSDDLDADARIAFDGEALVLHIASGFGPHRLELSAWSDDLFTWTHTGALAGLGGTLTVAQDAGCVTGLRLNTLRTRGLTFQRVDEPEKVTM